jgi:hypothetical protein
VRGEKEKTSRKGERGEEERPANGDRDSNTKKGDSGGRRDGRGERRVSTAQKMEEEGAPADF